MTTELEKQFFDTFGIEPREFKSCDVGTFCPYDNQLCNDTCPYYRTYKVDYPAISDRILLELMYLIGQQRFGFLYCENTFSTGLGNPKDLVMVQAENFKEGILTLAIQKKTVLRIKKDVQALFKEE